MERDRLFLLAAPFEDGARSWFCTECAMLEGALLANPHWAEQIEVHRIGFSRPRAEVVALIGEEHQGLPVLVLKPGAEPPFGAKRSGERLFLKHAVTITDYLAAAYGGAGPHP